MPQYLLAMTIFGTIGLFVRFIDLPSEMIALARGGIGALFLFLIIRLLGKRLDRSAIRRNFPALFIGGAALGFNWIFLFEAFQRTSIASATLAYYMTPIIIILLSPVVLRERVSAFKMCCAATALFGMSLISGIWSGDAPEIDGILMGLIAACFYSTLVFANKFLKDIGPYDTSSMQLSLSACVLLPYVLFSTDFSSFSPDATSILFAVVVAVLHTGVAYGLYFSAIPKLEAARIAIFSFVDPAVAILLSIFVLGEAMTTAGIIGAVLILGAALASELVGLKKAA